MSSTRKFIQWALIALAGIVVALGLSMIGNGSASAATAPAPKPVVTNPIADAIANGQRAIADVQTQVAKALAPKAAVKKVAAPVAPVAPAVKSTPATTPLEKFITNLLPESIPDMFIKRADPVANIVLTVTNGQTTKLPSAPKQMDKSARISDQIKATLDMVQVKEIAPDLGKCDESSTEAKVACGAGIVADNQNSGEPMPKIDLFGRYSGKLTDVGFHDGKPVYCGGFIAPTKMCQQHIYISPIVVDSLSGRNSTAADYANVLGHEWRHSQQERQFTDKTGDKWSYYTTAGSNLAFSTAAERDADEGSGVVAERALRKGQLTSNDIAVYEQALVRAGRAEGNTKDPHATGSERVAYYTAGRVLEQNGLGLPNFAAAMR